MYIRDHLGHPFPHRQHPFSPAFEGFGGAFGDPPAEPLAPPIISKPRFLGKDGRCIEMPPPRTISLKDDTLYTEIPLGFDEAQARSGKMIKVQPMTGIFMPPGFKGFDGARGLVLNLILYLHGFTDTHPGDGVAIDGYWDATKNPYFALREGLRDNGRKNTILVAPTLGPKSQAGGLVFWPDHYLDQVLLALVAHSSSKYPGGTRPRYLNLVLASHSGGGFPMRKMALGLKRYASNLQECWGFDALNEGAAETTEWITWAKANPTKKLYIHYCDAPGCRSTKDNSLRLQGSRDKPSNIKVEKSTATDHFWVPLKHWNDRIQQAQLPDHPLSAP
jgi:hypothetical protein